MCSSDLPTEPTDQIASVNDEVGLSESMDQATPSQAELISDEVMADVAATTLEDEVVPAEVVSETPLPSARSE